jgi:hypothetical protein
MLVALWAVVKAGDMGKKRSRTTTRRSRVELHIRKEVQYIISRAAAHDGRIVTLGPVLFFSTESGDAWMLDPEDHLAVCLARDGEALDVGLTETEDRFTVAWTHVYRIDGEVMTFVDQAGAARSILGYPTREITLAMRRMR